MIDTRPPLHMYADAASGFRDPFVSSNSQETYPSTGWTAHSKWFDINRALTPPPDMTGVSHSNREGHQQEHGNHFGNYMAAKSTFRPSVAPYLPQDMSNTEYYGGYSIQPNSRPISPDPASRQAPADGQQTQTRRGSQANAIAPSFQIPRSVNDSGGSLSELAAQITCLFWFESSDILQQIEDSPIPLKPTRQLVADAKPTTGFRKWVTTILSTTLVAQNVVLLALLFVYRLKKMNPTVQGKPGSEYRLLTVALMLGNKFLDDNTYTNKTWAEVSGINVAEVHIMEVEFLSNMKYCLFTSAEDWSKWQSLLGKFASFFERASRPPPPNPPAPILPPASSLYLPVALPSPPASNQASPPYVADVAHTGSGHSNSVVNGPTPAPSPLPALPNGNLAYPNGRKRSLEDHSGEQPAKRIATGLPTNLSPLRYTTTAAQCHSNQPVPRLTLPSLSIPGNQANSNVAPTSQAQHLPPLSASNRAMAMVFQNPTSQPHVPQLAAVAAPPAQSQSQAPSQHPSRQQSPFPGSAVGSPMSAYPQSATSLQPSVHVSPTYYLQQRNSPYRPVHNVSTLNCPASSSAIQHRPQSVGNSQMHYQPLGKPFQQRQTGRLPYITQNVWLDGNGEQAMTPVNQWPSFAQVNQRQSMAPQQ